MLDRMQVWTERINLGIMVLNGIWILTIPSFPTLDGWTHLHTARMLSDGQYGQLFCANEGLVPNQLGHWLLAALLHLFSPLLAERVFLALIVTTMGLGTHALARAFARPNLLVLLVLPFTYGFLLVMGFHNFLLGIGLALCFAAWWVQASAKRKAHYAVLLLSGIVLYCTHTMALIFFLAICGTHELTIVLGWQTRPQGWTKGRVGTLVAFALAVLPSFLLFLAFDLGQEKTWGQVERGQLLRELIDLRYLILFAEHNEVKFTYAMKLVLVGSFILALFHRIVQANPLKTRHADLLLLLGSLFLVLYFNIPDSAGFAGYISLRLQLFALLSIILWSAVQPIPKAAALAPALMLIMLHQARLNHIRKFAAPLAVPRDQVLDAARHIPEGAVVLPIHAVGNWELGHIPSLLAVDREIDLLYNYEASTDYFPLRWCPGMPDELMRHLGGQDRCLSWLDRHLTEEAWPRIDHIALIGEVVKDKPCYADALEAVLAEHFEPAYTNGLVSIHRRISR
jgi:hypothetical protein